jgi:hypothetical protein
MAFSPSARPWRGPHRLQDRLVHLLGIETQPRSIRLHDRDPANKSFASITLFLKFFGQLPDLIFEIVLLDRAPRDQRVLPLALVSGVDLTVETLLVNRRGTDLQDGRNTAHVQRIFFGRMRLGDRQMFHEAPLQVFANVLAWTSSARQPFKPARPASERLSCPCPFGCQIVIDGKRGTDIRESLFTVPDPRLSSPATWSGSKRLR